MNQPSENREEQLMQKISEKEKEVNLLHSQQRDVRFLAKRLHNEVLIRLNRRANANKANKSLYYINDPSVSKLASSKPMSSEEILNSVHTLDKNNVRVKSNGVSNYTKILFWKLAAKFYIMITKVAKKLISR